MVQETHVPAVQGTILKVIYVPTASGEQIDAQILLKGSPLLTAWRDDHLHHTIDPELIWHEEDCIYCQQCHAVCEHGCLHLTDEKLEIDRENCTARGACIKECPSMALEIVGEVTTAGDLLHKMLRQNYKIARKISRVTITGGEPGLQPAFCADLIFQLSSAHKYIVLETSGHVPYENLHPLLYHPAEVNFELITVNPILHQRLTGYDNNLILNNLTRLAAEKPPETQLVVRTPLIRDRTATQAELTATGNWMAANLLPDLPDWELFEPVAICEDTIPFTAVERAQILGWARQVYPPDKVIVNND